MVRGEGRVAGTAVNGDWSDVLRTLGAWSLSAWPVSTGDCWSSDGCPADLRVTHLVHFQRIYFISITWSVSGQTTCFHVHDGT